MRRLTFFVVALGIAWSAYWLIGKTAKEQVITAWLEGRRAAGWTVEYSDFQVAGFPNRFDSRFRDLELYSPVSGFGWATPEFHIFALSYRPNHIIAAFANRQVVTLPFEQIEINSDEMLASVVFAPDTLLAVDRISLTADNLDLDSSIGWRSRADRFSLATRRVVAGNFAHEVAFEATGVTPTNAFRNGLDPKGQLPLVIERVWLDLTLDFNAPWDRVAVECGAPEVTGIGLNDVAIRWGDLELKANGTLVVDPDGQINGRIGLVIRNWRQVLDLVVLAGLIGERTAVAVSNALSVLTAATENPESLSVPLVLENGAMVLGPVTIGPAPRFVRR